LQYYANPLQADATDAGRQQMRAKSLAFAAWAGVLAACKGEHPVAVKHFESKFPRSLHLDEIRKAAVLKTAVAPGTTTDSVWASPMAQPGALGAAFVEYIRPMTVVGRMQQDFRTIPLNVFGAETNSGRQRWMDGPRRASDRVVA
jgi:hypothetical protein